MGHYLDIHLRPDPELAPHHLLSGLYARLHRALVQLESTDIGVSFPGYDERKPTLGGQLRLHGPTASLHTLMATPWLHGMHDHLIVSDVSAAPTDARHRQVRRVQTDSSPDRQRRRAMRRHGLTEAQAQQRIPDSAARKLHLPYVVLGSRSTGQPSFRLFIRQGPLLSEPSPGQFNSYGLSTGATIPYF
jgi:CRISPR-associated endonuclease Csy4